jgi:formylglycine-generating enzyme required for sulfatase activity/Spy/CpxP family protein refolding chaperone
MSENFDPYLKWLGIDPEDQPPNHYRLLGIKLFQADPDVIANAADQRMAHVRSFQSGVHSGDSQQILNEIAKARICLLNPARKAEYDNTLSLQTATTAVLTAAPATACDAMDLGFDFATSAPAANTPPPRRPHASRSSGKLPWQVPACVGAGLAALLVICIVLVATKPPEKKSGIGPTTSIAVSQTPAPTPPPRPDAPRPDAPRPDTPHEQRPQSLVAAAYVNGPWVRLVNSKSGRCIAVAEEASGDRDTLHIYTPRAGAVEQQWRIESTDRPGLYRLRNRKSGGYIAVRGVNRNDAFCLAPPNTPLENASFAIDDLGDKRVKIVNQGSGFCMGVWGGTTNEGQWVVQWPFAADCLDHRWLLESAEPNELAGAPRDENPSAENSLTAILANSKKLGYRFRWLGGSDAGATGAIVTNILVAGNNLTIQYDYQHGRIVGSLDGRILRGLWKQDNGEGPVALEFAADYARASGTWSDGAQPGQMQHPAFLDSGGGSGTRDAPQISEIHAPAKAPPAPKPKQPFAGLFFLRGITLTPAQQSEVDALSDQYVPRLKLQAEQFRTLITPEQSKASEQALRAARAAGKKGIDLYNAGQEAMALSAEQKSKLAEVRKAGQMLFEEFRHKVMAILTPEQQAALGRSVSPQRTTTTVPGARFSLSPMPEVSAYPGETSVVSVRMQRNGYYGAVEVRLAGLPPNLGAASAMLPADQSQVLLDLTAGDGVSPGEYNARVIATAGGTTVDESLKITVGRRPPVRPFVIPMNGLGGHKQMMPVSFGPDWLGFNQMASPAAWEAPGELARLATKAALGYPRVPVAHYVMEMELEMLRPETGLRICLGDPRSAVHWDMYWNQERQKVAAKLAQWRYGGWGWAGGREFDVGERLPLKWLVLDGRQVMFLRNRPILGVEGVWPSDLTLRIWSEHPLSALVHRCSFRPIREEDMAVVNAPLPQETLALDVDASKQRFEAFRHGVPNHPVKGKDFTLLKSGTPLVWIAPGEFEMGSRDGNSASRHRVRISRGFWMGRFVVTQGEWSKMMSTSSNPSRFHGSPYLPVDTVTWQDAARFCQAIQRAEFRQHHIPSGYIYRLPTDAEWEYACRAGGDDELSGPAGEIWSRETSQGRPHEVGEKRPNAWGLYDMQGNAMQWCMDAWYDYPKYSGTPTVDPFHPGDPTKDAFVVRGGAWWAPLDMCRSCWRDRNHCEPANGYRGFRLVLGPILAATKENE